MPAYANVPVKVAGVWVGAIPSVGVAGAWQTVTEGWAKVSGVWQQFYAASSALAFLVFPSDVYSSRSGAGSLTSAASSGTATGGTPGYTYAWTYVSGNSYTIDSPASNSTTFTTTLSAGQLKSGVYRLTVTDAASATVQADVTIDMEAV